MMKVKINKYLVLMGIVFIVGCDLASDNTAVEATSDNGMNSNKVRATVDGTFITQDDLNESLSSIFNIDSARALADGDVDKIQKKVLESLVTMRAIALQQEKKLSRDEKYLLEAKVRRYKEELLVEQYLRSHTEPQPPTESEVQAYYEKHLDRYTSAGHRQFEVLRSEIVESKRLDGLLKALQLASGQTAWRKQSEQLKRQGYKVNYVTSSTHGPAIDRRLLSVINGLQEGQSSKVVYVDKQPIIVRVTKIRDAVVRPINEVKFEIRKVLALKNMKVEIKQASEEAKQMVSIEYH